MARSISALRLPLAANAFAFLWRHIYGSLPDTAKGMNAPRVDEPVAGQQRDSSCAAIQWRSSDMHTILEFLDIASAATGNEQVLELIEGEFEACINNGDLLGAGEWCASKLDHVPKSDADSLIAKVLAMWASPADLSFSPSNLDDLIANIERFNRDDLALALAGLTARRTHTIESNPSLLKDPAFRLAAELERLFGEHRDRPIDICMQAAAHIDRALAQAQEALHGFEASKCISARTAALEVVKKNRQLKAFSNRREHPILSRDRT